MTLILTPSNVIYKPELDGLTDVHTSAGISVWGPTSGFQLLQGGADRRNAGDALGHHVSVQASTRWMPDWSVL